MQPKPRFDELTEDRIRQIEATWKSDIEGKIDMLIKRELRRERLWDAIIDKGLTMLIVSGAVALFSLAWSGAMGELASKLAGKK